MSDSVLVAIIAGLSSALPAILICIIQNGSTRKILEYRTKKLEDVVEKLDSIVDRLKDKLSEIDVINSRIKNLETRVEILERKESK